MTQESGTGSFGGGIYLTIALLAGAGIGIYVGQPSAGILAGLVAGAAAATIDWSIRRKR